MKIHEYQAKELLKKYGLPTQKGILIENADNASKAAKKIGGNFWIIKAQILAGGRGKGGGVKLAKSLNEVSQYAEQMLGMSLITAQTDKEGKSVKKVYIVNGVNIKKEYYLGIILDRTLEMPVIIASLEGGMEIEKIAGETPEKIIKLAIDPQIGIRDFHIRKIGYNLQFDTKQMKLFVDFVKKLYNLYITKDAEIVEINPLVLTEENRFIALDAKINFDDNALFRHKEIVAMRDMDEEDMIEIEADKYGLNYVKLAGNVGCMVNGAGLAMATMDIIKHEGGEPANFLDVGGKASSETVAKGFEIILKDPNVKAIFVNIFGGIVRCDRIANGIIEAAKMTRINIPVIVRLDGTNAKEAVNILKKAEIDNIIIASNISDGAKKVVKFAKERQQ